MKLTASFFSAGALISSFILIFLVLDPPGAQSQRLSTRPLLQSYYLFSHESPYSSQFNFFGAYQYCRSIGMALISFESVEEVETIHEYLRNTSADKQEYWTSGNVLGTKDRDFVQWIWMSTGVQYNASLARFWAGTGSNFYAQNLNLPAQARQTIYNAADLTASNPYAGNQDCMSLSPGPIFQGQACEKRLQYICESAQYYFVNQRPVINKPYSRTLPGFSQRRAVVQDNLPFSSSGSAEPKMAQRIQVKIIPVSSNREVPPASPKKDKSLFDSILKQVGEQDPGSNQENAWRSSGSSGPSLFNTGNCTYSSSGFPVPCIHVIRQEVRRLESGDENRQQAASFGGGDRESLLVAHRRQSYNLTFQIRAPASPLQEAFIINPIESSVLNGRDPGDNEAEIPREEGTSERAEVASVDGDERHVEATQLKAALPTSLERDREHEPDANQPNNDFNHGLDPSNVSRNNAEVSSEWWHFITPRQQKHYWQAASLPPS